MVVLAGNKKDRQQDIVAGLREAAEKRANKKGMQYCEVSAFEIDDHVEELFKRIARDILNKEPQEAPTRSCQVM